MHTLKVTLKQHTPLIHFQHDQDGATLRASEVKPKLDRYLFEKAIDESFDGCKTFLKGYSDKSENTLRRKYTQEGFRALDYKISINPINRIELTLHPHYDNGKRKYVSDLFPMILNNMGGKDSIDELADFSMYDRVDVTFNSKSEDLIDMIADWSDLFFATNNFGQRQDKGFGSFSVIEVDGEVRVFPKDDLPDNTRFLKLSLSPRAEEFEKQMQLFQTIDFYWKCLKSGINYTKKRDQVFPERYIKAFLWTYLNNKGQTWEKRRVKECFDLTTGEEKPENINTLSFARAILGCPDKFEYKNKGKTVSIGHTSAKESTDYIGRIPSPIIFKPVFEGNTVRVYLLIDETAVCQLKQSNNLSFAFECEHKTIQIDINPNIVDFHDLLKGYHSYLAKKIKLKAFNYDGESDEYSENNSLEGKSWFIPLDFNWNRIIKSNQCWVEMYILNKK